MSIHLMIFNAYIRAVSDAWLRAGFYPVQVSEANGLKQLLGFTQFTGEKSTLLKSGRRQMLSKKPKQSLLKL